MINIIVTVYTFKMKWNVRITHTARKQREKLPGDIQELFSTLLLNLKETGPYQPGWKNFGKLRANVFHCHLKKGYPTYVAI